MKYKDEEVAKFYDQPEHRSVAGKTGYMRYRDLRLADPEFRTHYEFRRNMYAVLAVAMKPLWRWRGQIDRALAGGLVAFERGFFDGCQMVWDWTQTPRRSEFADWD